MPYIGNNIRSADDYRLIDDLSSSFDGSTTSFPLQVSGVSPVPFPKSPQQVLISVNGVIQEPDPTGSAGFNIVGNNIVFSSAPANGQAFFGIIYATADYINAGGTFPSGSSSVPSITFSADTDTGLYRKASGTVGFVSDGTEVGSFDSNGIHSISIDVTGNITVTGTVDGVDVGALNTTVSGLNTTVSGLNTTVSGLNTSVSGITSNATHTGEVTGATGLTIADNVVDEANLKVSNTPTDGYVLTAQSGNTGGLTWAEASGGGLAGGGDEEIFVEVDYIMNNSFTTTTGKNYIGLSSLAIASGVVFTITNGSVVSFSNPFEL